MAPTFTLLIFCLVQFSVSKAENFEKPLYLTPFIKAGRADKAKALAEVTQLSPKVESYSGLITVDKSNYGLHNFFWFFPAENNPDSAPVVLWSDGGPGVSCLFSIFSGNGPYFVEKDGTLGLREASWTKNYSVIFIDQPVDVGFSQAEKEEGYVTSAAQGAPFIYEFLMQFFKMFPELKGNDFYNAGGSYGGMYAPTFAHYIHTKNLENPAEKLNLKGIFMDSPWFDPINQMNYGEHLYHTGLIDNPTRKYFNSEIDKMKALMLEGNYEEAGKIHTALIMGGPGETYYHKITGLGTLYNLLRTQFDIDLASGITMGNSPTFRNAVHVGNLSFHIYSPKVPGLFIASVMQSAAPLVEELLDYGYKLMIVSSQLDIICSHVGIDTAVQNLKWKGSEAFLKAPREIWTIDDNVVGYIKSSTDLTYISVRNAGHCVVLDKQEIGLQLFDRLTSEAKQSLHKNCIENLEDGTCEVKS